MQIAQVVGTAVASVKHESMISAKLLLVQPLLEDCESPDGNPMLVIDRLGAGRADRVLITSDGETIQSVLGEDTPVRFSVMGLCDR